MSAFFRRAPRAVVPALLVVLAAACADEPTRPRATRPEPVAPSLAADGPRFSCVVVTRDRSMTCTPLARPADPLPAGVRANRVIGGSDMYMKLTAESFTFDPATRRLDQRVSVQNLLSSAVGTTDGINAAGFVVFLDGDPITTDGTGVVTVTNADGRGHFTAPNGQTNDQPYWTYSQMLEPYEISRSRTWQFEVPVNVASFRFTAFVSVPMVDESAPMLDAVWDGSAGSAWSTADSWVSGGAPTPTSVVAILNATMLGAGRNLVELVSDVSVRALRVGQGSSLDLRGWRITVDGNVDAVGPVTGGTVAVTGAGARLGGTLPAVVVAGSARLQRPVLATGPVSVSGSLAVTDSTPLVISIP